MCRPAEGNYTRQLFSHTDSPGGYSSRGEFKRRGLSLKSEGKEQEKRKREGERQQHNTNQVSEKYSSSLAIFVCARARASYNSAVARSTGTCCSTKREGATQNARRPGRDKPAEICVSSSRCAVPRLITQRHSELIRRIIFRNNPIRRVRAFAGADDRVGGGVETVRRCRHLFFTADNFTNAAHGY